jgi:hypothetical protein
LRATVSARGSYAPPIRHRPGQAADPAALDARSSSRGLGSTRWGSRRRPPTSLRG